MKQMAMKTKYMNFWWLMTKSAGNFNNFVKKTSNNISKIVWLITFQLHMLTLTINIECLFCYLLLTHSDSTYALE